jgi:nitrite reductase (NO-forming)
MKALLSVGLLVVGILFVVTGCTGRAEGQPLEGAATFEFTLRTGLENGRMVFIGVGGEIDGLVNPDLPVVAGEAVHITLVNGDGMMHDLAIPDLALQTATAMRQQATVDVTFTPRDAGVYAYICTISGHRQVGMEGALIVTPVN